MRGTTRSAASRSSWRESTPPRLRTWKPLAAGSRRHTEFARGDIEGGTRGHRKRALELARTRQGPAGAVIRRSADHAAASVRAARAGRGRERRRRAPRESWLRLRSASTAGDSDAAAWRSTLVEASGARRGVPSIAVASCAHARRWLDAAELVRFSRRGLRRCGSTLYAETEATRGRRTASTRSTLPFGRRDEVRRGARVLPLRRHDVVCYDAAGDGEALLAARRALNGRSRARSARW